MPPFPDPFLLFEQELSFLCSWGFGVDIRAILTRGLECYQLHAVLGLWQDFIRISRPPREGRRLCHLMASYPIHLLDYYCAFDHSSRLFYAAPISP